MTVEQFLFNNLTCMLTRLQYMNPLRTTTTNDGQNQIRITLKQYLVGCFSGSHKINIISWQSSAISYRFCNLIIYILPYSTNTLDNKTLCQMIIMPISTNDKEFLHMTCTYQQSNQHQYTTKSRLGGYIHCSFSLWRYKGNKQIIKVLNHGQWVLMTQT